MLRQALRRTVDLLYPPRCAGCGAFDTVLCPVCAAAMEPALGPGRCRFCAARWEGDGNCPRCFHMHRLQGVRAAFEMSGVARRLVHELKYRYYRAATPEMSSRMAPLPSGLAIDRYFAVPLHHSRVRERGFNQSDLLLRAAGWPPAPGLARARKTERQVGQRLADRLKNVSGAFVYSGPRLDGLVVALVDDVVTTGATMAECAAVLADSGARAVWGLAFARASYRPDAAPDYVLDD